MKINWNPTLFSRKVMVKWAEDDQWGAGKQGEFSLSFTVWFAPVIEGLLYVEDFTTNWFLRTWPYMEFICTCSSIVNWKIKLIWQRRLLHMSISVEATGKILYLQFVFHMRLVSFEVRSVVTLLKCKLRNELLGF